MSEVMPPNVTGCAKKKKKEKIQQVPPTPQQRPVSPVEEPTKVSVPIPPVRQKSHTNPTVTNGTPKEVESTTCDDMPLIDTSSNTARIPHNSTTSLSSKRSGSTNSASSPHSLRSARERTPSITYNKGQIIKPQPAPESSLAASVAGLVQDAIPSNSQSPAILPETVEWVQVYNVDKAGDPVKTMTVLVVGLSRGFQIWILNEKNELEEVMSERNGAVRVLVPLPCNIEPIDDSKDLFSGVRPVVALVDAYSHVPDRQFCTVSIVSLTSKRVVRCPSSTTAFDEPVSSVLASSKFMVVALQSQIAVYDMWSFTHRFTVRTGIPVEGIALPCALSGQMLVYADERLSQTHLSCGGMDSDGAATPSTYTSQMMKVAKASVRSVSTLYESMKGSAAAGTKEQPRGIATVIDLTRSADDENGRVMAHWAAQRTELSHLGWSPDGRMVISADLHGLCFHVFSVLAHASCSGLSSVQQLYRLHRGETPAKVQSFAWSADSRWVSVATNHGTCHIFAICPYGGPPTIRTHGVLFTNKESRFLRSAGLTDTPQIARGGKHPSGGTHSAYRVHPALHSSKSRIFAKATGNPRIGPFPSPVLLTATEKVKDPRVSADKLTQWATDLTPLTWNAAGKKTRMPDLPRAAMSWRTDAAGAMTMLVVWAEGGLVLEYGISPVEATLRSHSEEEPKLTVSCDTMWTLQRTKNNADIPAPLQVGSPLVLWGTANACAEQEKSDDNGQWVPHVEVCTYSGPSRRLWLGPQFSFFEYKEENSAELITPSSSHQSLTKSIPIVVGGANDDRRIEDSEATRIECGSWMSQSSLAQPEGGADISEKIADAIRDVNIEMVVPRQRHASVLEELASDSPTESTRQSTASDEDLLGFDDF